MIDRRPRPSLPLPFVGTRASTQPGRALVDMVVVDPLPTTAPRNMKSVCIMY